MSNMEALHALSLARTALDDPAGLSEEDFAQVQDKDKRPKGPLAYLGTEVPAVSEEALKEYAIDRIDDAMRLLGADDEEKTARFYQGQRFDAENSSGAGDP